MKNKKRCYPMLAVLLAAVIFACAACAQSPSEEQNNINEETEQQETIEIFLSSPIQIFKIIKRRLKSTVLMSERMGTVLCWRLLRNREKL